MRRALPLSQDVDYTAWESVVPASITGDSLWRVRAYRLALFLSEAAWVDATALYGDVRTRGLADQLIRSVGSVSANIAEGFSRGTARDQVRFYEYALGSAREARDWYYKAQHVLGPALSEERMLRFTEIIRLLLATVQRHNTRVIRRPARP